MTRIIAGRFGGRRLKVPDEGTRPTADRVREAVFNMLDARGHLGGARILDLYAGSGALGFEALSRGAIEAVFVDNRRRAASVISANAAALDTSGSVRVATAPVSEFLAGAPATPFDVVFSDPPYDLPATAVANDLAVLTEGWLSAEGIVVVERARRNPVEWPPNWNVLVDKVYGDTVVQLGRCGSEHNDGDGHR